ncbi:acyl-[acyl-carrier-protein] thioesterase [Chloroflexota bacterium]
MSKIFTRRFRVRWSEVGANGQVGPAGYLRYLVETAWDWGIACGLGVDESKEFGLAWVIRETEINFIRPLRHNDIVDFTIWLINWRRVRGTRAFELKLKDSGEVIAQGVQQVVSLDEKSMRPVSPPAYIMESFFIEDPRVFPHQRFPKDLPEYESLNLTERDVEWQDLDEMEHVNNAAYITYAQEALAQNLAVMGWPPAHLKDQGLAVDYGRIHIIYLSPAVWGDRLDVRSYTLGRGDTGGQLYIAVARKSDGEKIFNCILDWFLVDRISGEKQPVSRLYPKREANDTNK